MIFTLVPHSQACQPQARELASALKVDLIVPPFVDFTTVDGGGHLDKKGATKFSQFFFSALVGKDVFKRIASDSFSAGADRSVR